MSSLSDERRLPVNPVNQVNRPDLLHLKTTRRHIESVHSSTHPTLEFMIIRTATNKYNNDDDDDEYIIQNTECVYC